jgi:hypothetical protein
MKQKLSGGYAYGLYRFNIYKSGDPKIDRLFRFKPIDLFNNDNILQKSFYTSIDLKIADMLGLKKELIEDNNINCVLYPRSHCLTGFEVFNKFTEVLKPLKEEKVDGAKLLLNILSGCLGEKNLKKMVIDDDIDDNIDDNTIKSLELSDNDIFICLDNAISDKDKVTLQDKGLIKTI